jgi:hypothetical protein
VDGEKKAFNVTMNESIFAHRRDVGLKRAKWADFSDTDRASEGDRHSHAVDEIFETFVGKAKKLDSF